MFLLIYYTFFNVPLFIFLLNVIVLLNMTCEQVSSKVLTLYLHTYIPLRLYDSRELENMNHLSEVNAFLALLKGNLL